MSAPPLMVVHGAAALEEAQDDLATIGWKLTPGWKLPRERHGLVVHGKVTQNEEIAAVTFAAVVGVGVLVDCAGDRAVSEALCDELRRLGTVTHRSAELGWVVLDRDERRLLDMLGSGQSLGEAARTLHLARRSADRRLAAARTRLGVAATGAAVALRRQRLTGLPTPPARRS